MGEILIMKLALICPSNKLYMPYVSNYEKILNANKVNYEIINWDRFHIEDANNSLKYRDLKTQHQRNYLDYYKYKKFIVERLNSTNYDKIIVFGIQLSYFLKSILIKEYKDKYILDIRDHNKIIKFFNIKRLIDNSMYTVISSPGYKEWLPSSDKYLINHNTQLDNLDDLKDISSKLEDKKISVAYIGALRDFAINIDLINSLKNNMEIELCFHGEGDINEDIDIYLKDNEINNVFLTGRYKKEDEESLYNRSDLINVLIPNSNVNNKTLLPNRLYNAAIHGKPVIAFKGTYLADIIEEYKLGLILDSFINMDIKVNKFIKEFDRKKFQNNRYRFLQKVIIENEQFKNKLNDFILLHKR
jgi:hypothetical protein